LDQYDTVYYYSRGYDWCEVVFCCTFRFRFVAVLKGTGPMIEWTWRDESACMKFVTEIGAAIKAHQEAKRAPIVQAVPRVQQQQHREASFDLSSADASASTSASVSVSTAPPKPKPSRVVPVAVPINDDDDEDE
jgi:hypothetical protein